ncbi:hypothetical protein BV20DRAFT_1007236 [Pilatotrama ljubarskyi]|nr:hypothetical protein BV20DRAFT_1007236 [Pilatotrama ljubarskyi]
MMDATDRELELRAHIHSLLSHYARKHLATDHVAWTEEEVANHLSECLRIIPTTDPTAVALPLDPFEVLSRQWALSKLDLYEEKWSLGGVADSIAYLKKHITALARQADAAEKHWREDTDAAYDGFLLERPMSPVLSARARQQTPTVGKGAYIAKLPQSWTQMLHWQSWAPNKAKEVKLEEVSVNADDILGNKLVMEAETHRSVLTLLQAVPALAKAPKPSECHHVHHVDDFLRASSPPLVNPELETLPIFPRTEGPYRNPLSKYTMSNTPGLPVKLEKLSQLSQALLSPVQMREEDEEDLAEEHLVIVDGWQAYRTSSPMTAGTPSLADSSSEVDELFMPSSPTVETLGADQLYMEEYQMPRSKRIGGGCCSTSFPGHANRLSDFLPPLMRPSQMHDPRIVRSPQSQPSSPRTAITMSILGQPPTALDVSHSIVARPGPDENPSSDDSVTFAVKTVERACGNRIDSDDPGDLILREKLDEKDGLLMDGTIHLGSVASRSVGPQETVPLMRPPNEHPIGDFAIPTRLTELLAPGKLNMHDTTVVGAGPTLRRGLAGYLRKVKGLQPLQIELSWIPFKYGRSVPTDEEVADVLNDPCPQLARDIGLAQQEIASRLSALLDESMAFGAQPLAPDSVPSTTAWSVEVGHHSTSACFEFDEPQLRILTRQDRRRLAGLPPASEHSGFTSDGGEFDHAGSSKDCIPAKEDQALLDTGPFNGETERPTKRVRFDESVLSMPSEGFAYATSFVEERDTDDSGMFLCEDVHSTTAHGARSYFEELAHHAEGFEGPQADVGLFFDLHPVHSGNFRFLCAPGSPVGGFSSSYDLDPRSPSRLDRRVPVGDDRPVEDFGRSTADPLSHQPANHDGRAALPPVSASSPAPLRPTAGSSTLTNHGLQPATVGTALGDFSAVRPPASRNSDLAAMSAQQSLAQFLALCGKRSLAGSSDASQVLLSDAEATNPPPAVFEVHAALSGSSADRSKNMPLELVNNSTLMLPAHIGRPDTGHRYMASLELIQRRALVRALDSWAVELVEREQLGSGAEDVHLILDCDTAVLFVTLEALPSCGETLAASLTQLSWRFPRILVVFECYPASWSFKGDRDFADKHVASAWSPPVVKAVKKLRRGLAIADGIQTKRVAAIIEYAFAHTVDDAAAYTRLYGDAAAARDQNGGVSWGERLWLTPDAYDGEYDLCGVDGMNLFAASLLLSQTSLEDFLERSADERLLEYGELVGAARMARFNVEMSRRLEAMRLPPSSPISGGASSSSNTIPCIQDSELDIY